MVSDNRVPHALLFAGREGTGTLASAVAFASHLFCKSPAAEGACGQCPSCLKTKRLSHPDLHLVFPIIKVKGSVESSDDLAGAFREALLQDPYMTSAKWSSEMDAGNKQPVIPVEEANGILRKLSYTSYEGSYKVMIIWQPERMNAESANRLLKILEEPPEKTIFIMVSSQADQLLATIWSRLQLVRFYPCSEEEITDALMRNFSVSREVAEQAAILADGSYAEAVAALAENDLAVSLLTSFQAFMRLGFRIDPVKASQWIDENAATGREKQKQFLQYALQVFRDSLMFNYGERALVKLSGAEKQFLEKFAPYVTQSNYEELVAQFNNSYYAIERNANPKILFMDLLIQTERLLSRR